MSARHGGKQDTENKIKSFTQLQDGWHYGEGVPFSALVVKSAISLNKKALDIGFNRTNAFPGIGGEIRVTVYHGIHYLEFTVESEEGLSLQECLLGLVHLYRI